ncbi:MAG: histidinol-phosphatase HisJ family protein [Verrucomicrobiaceae bacterium]|nr:MAG: histidinol-phosphatase HisJ family protein [Verrucomicrobiaceae bacterium]
MPADYHLHTPLCKHAAGSPAEFAAQAVRLGLPEIGFSDHSPMPMEFDDWRMLDAELPRYLELVDEARAAHRALPIRLGLEVDWLEGGEAWIESLSRRAPWDYLIGSVHYLGDWNFDHPDLVARFSSCGVEESWDRYWRLFRSAAKSGLFDIMAHPDLVKKFRHRPEGDLRRYYEPAVQACAEAGVAIEINTAGLFKPVAEMYPAPEFLKLAAEAGIPLTINSDAHSPQEVGRAFPEALELAKECGFTQLARFQGRRRTSVPLE